MGIAAVAAVTADPTTTTIARVTTITVITAAWRSRHHYSITAGRDDIDGNGGHINHCDHGCSSYERSARAAAASLAGADPRGQPDGHKATRNQSQPGCLASDDASDPQLARACTPALFAFYRWSAPCPAAAGASAV